MGGGAPGYRQYPKEVWTPMGGPYCDPPNSMRRGAFAAVAAIVVLIPFGMWLSKHFETRKLGHRPVFTERFSADRMDVDHPGWRSRPVDKRSFLSKVWPDKGH